MLVPKRLSIRGFRGYRGQEEFHFDTPATILFGENHTGKSSTLNAIEWCLFGDGCQGKQTGIRERIGWIVANQHQPAADVEVELHLANDTGSHIIRRSLRKEGKRAAIQELQLTPPGGKPCNGPEAAQRLAGLLQAEFRDFLTTVHQHQEAIRAVLTQEPKDRNDAIDRLLGLSAFRNMLDAVAGVRAGERHRALRQRFEAFERGVQTALATRAHDLQELRREAAQAGIPEEEQNAAAVHAFAATIKRELLAFAQDLGLAAPALPAANTWSELRAFESAVRKTIAWLRGEMPDVKERQELFGRQTALVQLQTNLEKARADMETIGRSCRELDTEFHGPRAVVAELAVVEQALTTERDGLRAANRHAALVREAIDYLGGLTSKPPASECPLCGHPAPELLTRLRTEWDRELAHSVRTIDVAIEQLGERQQALQAAQRCYQDLSQRLQRALEERTRSRQEVGARLGKTLDEEDDALSLLSIELQVIEDRARTLKESAAGKGQRLEVVEHDLEKFRVVRELLTKEEKRQTLERIQQAPAYREVEQMRDQSAEWLADTESIQSAIAMASREEAAEKLHAAEQIIDEYFRRLTQHPAVEGIRLRVSEVRQRNHYAITDAAGEDLAPVLSQGDLNSLALAIFLGLASVSGGRGSFGFVMLDDPSQSLGSEHKKQLVQVLDEVAHKKHVLVATMDAEFRGLLQAGLTRTKKEYVLGPWSVESGATLLPW